MREEINEPLESKVIRKMINKFYCKLTINPNKTQI